MRPLIRGASIPGWKRAWLCAVLGARMLGAWIRFCRGIHRANLQWGDRMELNYRCDIAFENNGSVHIDP